MDLPTNLREPTNDERRYLALAPIEPSWDRVQIDRWTVFVFDGDVLRRTIRIDGRGYVEMSYALPTVGRHTIAPLSARGKPRECVPSQLPRATSSTYLRFDRDGPLIASMATDRRYYSEEFEPPERRGSLDMDAWLRGFVAESTVEDLRSAAAFCGDEKRQRVRFRGGDVFAFPLARRGWGFGRVLLVLSELRKSPQFATLRGMAMMMTQPVLVQLYRFTAATPDVDIDRLRAAAALPAEYVSDNRLLYGEYPIVGFDRVDPDSTHDLPIHYGRTYSQTRDVAFLQRGTVIREASCETMTTSTDFRMAGIRIGFATCREQLDACVASGSNEPYWQLMPDWQAEGDLRHPKNEALRTELLDTFALAGHAETIAWPPPERDT